MTPRTRRLGRPVALPPMTLLAVATPAAASLRQHRPNQLYGRRSLPFIGYLHSVSMCSFWKYLQNPRQVDLVHVPRMLMFQSEGDPATAYEGSLAAHRATSGQTRFVAVDNEG